MKNWAADEIRESLFWAETPVIKQWKIDHVDLMIDQDIVEQNNEPLISFYMCDPSYWLRQYIEGPLINKIGRELSKVQYGAIANINGKTYQKIMPNDSFISLQSDYYNVYCENVYIYVGDQQYKVVDHRIAKLRELIRKIKVETPIEIEFEKYRQELVMPLYDKMSKIPFPDERILFINRFYFPMITTPFPEFVHRSNDESAECGAILEHPAYDPNSIYVCVRLEHIKAIFEAIAPNWLFAPELSKEKMIVFRKKLNEQFDWVIPFFQIDKYTTTNMIQALLVPAGLNKPLHPKYIKYGTKQYLFQLNFVWVTGLVKTSIILDHLENNVLPFVEMHMLDVIASDTSVGYRCYLH